MKSDELLPINVQRLYVLSALGKKDEAERLASDITLKEYVRIRNNLDVY